MKGEEGFKFVFGLEMNGNGEAPCMRDEEEEEEED